MFCLLNALFIRQCKRMTFSVRKPITNGLLQGVCPNCLRPDVGAPGHHTDYEVLTVKNIPQISDQSKSFSTYQWHGLFKHLHQMPIANSAMEEDSCRLYVYKQPRILNQNEKCATLVCNNKSPVTSLNSVVDKAWNMFSSRAYIHQYVKHGLSEEDFVDSFVTLEQVISNYNAL